MEYGRITPKQREILEYIKQEILNRGYPPTVRELCDAVHLKSTSSIHSHLESLEKNGYIRRDPSKPRAIEIVDDSFNLTRREMVNVPIIGSIAAGQPLLAIQNIENYFPIPAEYMPNQDTFMLRVKGESMINAGICDVPQGSRYAGRNLQIDRKRCQSALKRDTKAPGELFKILRGLILRIIKHRYVCYPQIEIVLHRFFCTKNLSHHRLFLSASVQLMHNHRTSFYVPARLFNSMSQSSIFRKKC